MITLITGTPGAGKTLMCVGDFLAKAIHETVPGPDGEKIKRRICTNINGLLIEHEKITADDLARWPEWARPGDLIVFDEVQETWRPRGMSQAVPDAIAKLEVHRHKGVDFILLTQHPMLLDQNVRRLVGRHLHVRRVAGMGLAIVYEWDHCSNPSSTKSAVASRPWRYPKEAFKLYKSAELHTKQKRRMPAAVAVLAVAVLAMAWGVPSAYSRFSEKYSGKPAAPSLIVEGPQQAEPATGPLAAPAGAAEPQPTTQQAQLRPAILGCVSMGSRCECYGASGYREEVPDDLCKEAAHRVAALVPLLATTVPPAGSLVDAAGMAAAPGQPSSGL